MVGPTDYENIIIDLNELGIHYHSLFYFVLNSGKVFSITASTPEQVEVLKNISSQYEVWPDQMQRENGI